MEKSALTFIGILLFSTCEFTTNFMFQLYINQFDDVEKKNESIQWFLQVHQFEHEPDMYLARRTLIVLNSNVQHHLVPPNVWTVDVNAPLKNWWHYRMIPIVVWLLALTIARQKVNMLMLVSQTIVTVTNLPCNFKRFLYKVFKYLFFYYY